MAWKVKEGSLRTFDVKAWDDIYAVRQIDDTDGEKVDVQYLTPKFLKAMKKAGGFGKNAFMDIVSVVKARNAIEADIFDRKKNVGMRVKFVGQKDKQAQVYKLIRVSTGKENTRRSEAEKIWLKTIVDTAKSYGLSGKKVNYIEKKMHQVYVMQQKACASCNLGEDLKNKVVAIFPSISGKKSGTLTPEATNILESISDLVSGGKRSAP